MTKHSYLIKSFLLLFSLSIFSFANAQYCSVNFTVANWSKIMNVKLTGNNNTIDNSSSNCDGYKDFTSLTPADLAAGGNYTLEVFKSNCTYQYQNQCNVWIDYNGNGIRLFQ